MGETDISPQPWGKCGGKSRAPAASIVPVVALAADALGIGRTKTYELIAAGELEVVHIGRCCRVPIDALEAYVAGLRGIRETGPGDSLRLRPTRSAPRNRA